MNAGPTASRIYDQLRSMVIHGEFRPGVHLDPTELAASLASSTTPVREALNRLTGDGLIETRQGSGFFLALPDVVSLKDLYAWIGDLVQLGLRHRAMTLPAAVPRDRAGTDYATRSAEVFAAMVNLSGNAEHRDAIERANARIHPFRMAEIGALADPQGELDTLENALLEGDPTLVRRLVNRHIRTRVCHASRIARARYRPS